MVQDALGAEGGVTVVGVLATLRPHARETGMERRHQRQPPLTAVSERGAAKCFGECGRRAATCVGGHGVFQEHCARLLLQGVDEGRYQHGYSEWGGVVVQGNGHCASSA